MAEATRLNRVAAALAGALEALVGRRLALVGGLAVSARSEPRFTRDVDLAVAVEDDEDAEQLVRALTGRGYRMPVACIGHLLAMKVLSHDDRRPQDGADLVALLGEANPEDVAVAQAVGLITQRGFHRGRDLAAGLDRWLS